MNPERWAQVKAVLAHALELPSQQRAPYLQRTCGEDAELRAEVESLLAAAARDDLLPAAREAVAVAARDALTSRGASLRAALEAALGRQYEILRPLGRGGMGDVYLARELALDRFVAIKVLRPDVAAIAEGRERFRREARIAAQLSHPNILRLYTFGEVDGLWYFVMGYVRGESLAERLRLEGRLPWLEAHRILMQLADALECAHQHGVVHRDIKPANILLEDGTGLAVLADFGISKLAGGDSLTATGAVVGTPDYMSPEQIVDSSEVDERSDIYSLGVVAYTMLAGREPFAGLSASEIMFRRISQDPLPIHVVAPGVPDALATAVMKCLARDRTQRFPDARTLKEALGRIGGASEATLPEEVRDLPSFAPYAVLWGAGWTALALLLARTSSDRLLLLLIALLVPVGLMLHVWNVGRHGLSAAELARVASWPPEWWGMWWPRALRRPTDLWTRLPRMGRAVRVCLSAFFVLAPGLVLVRQWLIVTGRLTPEHAANAWFLVGEAVLVASSALLVFAAFRWARTHQLTIAEASRVLFGATIASPAWNAPRIARLLASGAGRVRAPERERAGDHCRAIAEVLPLLPADALDAGRAAAVLADRLAGAIEQRDAELAELSRDAGSAEVDRLTTQLAALSDAASVDSRERAELRDLVRHQLDVVRRMQSRRELVWQERTHLFDLLRALWAQLCALCDAGHGERKERADRLSRLQRLGAEITEALERPSVPSPPGTIRQPAVMIDR